MKVIKAVDYVPKTEGSVLFLCGSIEMGKAEKWQDIIIEKLRYVRNLTILNPRRDDWDSSWVQSIKNPQFKRQVEWELEGIERAGIVTVYFDDQTQSPITLLELGLLCGSDKHVFVYCPDGYFRKGNVDIVSEQYELKQVSCLDEMATRIIEVCVRYENQV